MLRIYPFTLDVVRDSQRYVRLLAANDPDLARQYRRSLTSVPLNIAEGMYSRGGNRKARYHTALGSMREALACLEVGEALGYLAVAPALSARRRRIIGTLVKRVK